MKCLLFTGTLAVALFCGGLPDSCGDGVDWGVRPGPGVAEATGDGLRLELAEAGAAAVVSQPVAVVADAIMGLAFDYTSESLSSAVHLVAAVRWFDAAGKDIDDQRRQLGFPPLARDWHFTKNASAPIAVADNASVPGNAATAEIAFRLERAVAGRAARVRIRNVRFAEGAVQLAGVELPASGPADTGPLSTAPSGVRFAANLVENAAFEDGDDAPRGWQIEGDNTTGAAVWQNGGAFSGKRCLKLFDRGPYAKSWGEAKREVFLPGGKPGGNYANAREEVSARWVSEPVPAVPGKAYQATAFLWYANRQSRDRGNVNPVRIQFLDKQGRVLPYRNVWEDWLPNLKPFQVAGWVPVIGKPVVAPPAAVSVRAAVVMFHAFYDLDGGLVRKRTDDRGFVLVDNLSLYQVQTAQPLLNDDGNSVVLSPDAAFWDTAGAGGLPFVPTSVGHRFNTLAVESETGHPGGILFRTAESAAQSRTWLQRLSGRRQAADTAQELSLGLTNWLGDPRDIEINYEILDWDGQPVHSGRAAAMVPPFARDRTAIECPPGLPAGAYTIRFKIQAGGQLQDEGETRFAVLARRESTAAERGRMDYPFSLWNHRFRGVVGTADEPEMGRLMDVAGMGKTWFGCGGPVYISQLLNIKDPDARRQAVTARIDSAREAIAAWRRYGVTPMGHLECPHLMDPADYPVLAEVVTAFVSALKDDIHAWRYGTESMHGAVKELDRATVAADAKNGQGGQNYLYWGRQGTVRQYWAEYFVAYAAAKQADPACLFGPQCASDIEGNVLRLFFQVGTKDQLDCFGMNTYISAFAIWPPNMVELGKGDAADLPVFVSEFDAQARCSPIGPRRAAEEKEAVRRMVTYWTSVLAAFPTFFHLEQWGMIMGNDDGSLTYLNRVRPQFVAYATMTDILGAGQFAARHDIPQGVVYVRERSQRPGPVAVLWSTAPEAAAELEVGTSAVTLVDVMGNRRELAAVGGVVTVPLTPMPQYLTGAKIIRPARTVKLTLRHATRDPHRPRLAVTVSNERKDELAGTLTVKPESALKLSPPSYPVAGLRAGESRTFYFDVTPLDPGRAVRLPVRVHFTTPGRTYEAVDALNFHFATRALVPPVIDGDLADWPDGFPLVVDRADQFNGFTSSKPWGGTADLSGQIRLRWDEQNVYLAARVTDDVLELASAPGREFTMDSIELLFDPQRGLTKDAPFQMITLAGFQDGRPRVRRYDGALPKGDVAAARLAVKRVGNETLYEAAVPWTELAADFKPEPGRAVSIAFTFDDHDGGDSSRRGMSWFSLVSDKNPAAFGDVVLTDSEQARENLLLNGDFEDPALPPGAEMQGWRLWWPSDLEKNAAAALVTEGAHQGRSLRIERLNPTGIMTVGGWSLPARPGEVYLFRARVRADERSVLVWLNPADAAGKGLPALAWIKPLTPGCTTHYQRDINLVVAQFPDRDTYHPVEAVFAIPDGATSLSISFAYNWANGAAFIDDCELYRLCEAGE